jgi:hypothetical protein
MTNPENIPGYYYVSGYINGPPSKLVSFSISPPADLYNAITSTQATLNAMIDAGVTNAGQVYAFVNNGGFWVQVGMYPCYGNRAPTG